MQPARGICELCSLALVSYSIQPRQKCLAGWVISASNFRSQGPGFESLWRWNSAHDYTAFHCIAFNYHPSIILIWPQQCWKWQKTPHYNQHPIQAAETTRKFASLDENVFSEFRRLLCFLYIHVLWLQYFLYIHVLCMVEQSSLLAFALGRKPHTCIRNQWQSYILILLLG